MDIQPGQSGIIFDSVPTIDINLIDAGQDIILNPFSEYSIFNVVDGSVDTIRKLGSESLNSLVNAKIDKI